MNDDESSRRGMIAEQVFERAEKPTTAGGRGVMRDKVEKERILDGEIPTEQTCQLHPPAAAMKTSRPAS